MSGLTRVVFFEFALGWNRIVSRSSPGVATQDSFGPKPESDKRPMNFDSLNCIFRAGGVVPARCRSQRGYSIFVNINRHQQNQPDNLQNQFQHIFHYPNVTTITGCGFRKRFKKS